MKGVLQGLGSLAAACLVGVSVGCSHLRQPSCADVCDALQNYVEKNKINAGKKIGRQKTEKRELGSYALSCFSPEFEDFGLDFNKHEYYFVLGKKKKKPETLEQLLTPDIFSIQLVAPKYKARSEKRELRAWNKIAKGLGFGKIRGFANRNAIENAYLEVSGKYAFSRALENPYSDRIFLGLKTRYGKDTVENDLDFIDVDITDRFCGAGADLTFYPDLKEFEKQGFVWISMGIDYSTLDVDVNVHGFDSATSGLGYYARAGIGIKPNNISPLLKLIRFPDNSMLGVYFGVRDETLKGDRETDNTGIEFGIEFSVIGR